MEKQATGKEAAHEAAVSSISAAVRAFHTAGKSFRIFHGATNSTRSPQYSRNAVVDTSSLDHVLSVDAASLTARVEPNVSMAALVRATLAHGALPQVVMELPGITAGGGFAGNSGESSSWRYGLFDSTVSALEVVLATGEVVRASASENADLFFGAAGSYGTLGVITLLDIRLVPAQTHVELTYHPVGDAASALVEMQRLFAEPGVLYIDAILYGPAEGVVMAGRLAAKPRDRKAVRFLRPHDPQFYLHARRQAKRRDRTEFIPVEDYFFRYDRGGFWVGRYAFRYFAVPYNRVSRFLLDRFMRARPMFHAFHESGLAEQYVVQDITVPAANLTPFVDYIAAELAIWPLWLCPIVAEPSQRTLPKHMRDPVGAEELSAGAGGEAEGEQKKTAMFVNVGIWGDGAREHAAFVALNRDLERRATELDGAKALYARSYYTENEFWEIYDREAYDELRTRWHANTLPSIYDKMNAGSATAQKKRTGLGKIWDRRPFAGVRGVAKLVLGSNYLFPK